MFNTFQKNLYYSKLGKPFIIFTFPTQEPFFSLFKIAGCTMDIVALSSVVSRKCIVKWHVRQQILGSNLLRIVKIKIRVLVSVTGFTVLKFDTQTIMS